MKLSQFLVWSLLFAFSASAFAGGGSKPQITKENVYVQCQHQDKRGKTAFQFLIENGSVRYLQPFTGKITGNSENKSSLIQAKTQVNSQDETGFNFGFHPRRVKKGSGQLKIFGSKMVASSIWIPGGFLRDPKSVRKSQVVALLAQDQAGVPVKGQNRTQAFNCAINELR